MAKQVIQIAVDVPEGFEISGDFVLRNVRMDGSAVDGHIPLRKVEPVRESRWINLYGADSVTASVFSDRDACDRHSSHTRKAVLRIDYENARPVSATVEGVE
jgi:hypothetical protein